MTEHQSNPTPAGRDGFTIADRLRKARAATGLNQTDFAQRIGQVRQTVSNYESSKYTRTRKHTTLAAWALATGYGVEWIETGIVNLTDTDPDGPGGQPMVSVIDGQSFACTRPLVGLVSDLADAA